MDTVAAHNNGSNHHSNHRNHRHAKQNPRAVIVTNDMFRDHVDKHKGNKRELRQWLKAHCLTYTFVNDEFLPNPDFVFPND